MIGRSEFPSTNIASASHEPLSPSRRMILMRATPLFFVAPLVIALVTLPFASPVARAELLPGPERIVAEAELVVTAASGSYAATKRVKVTQLARADEDVSAFLVELNGEPHRFEPSALRRPGCGDLHFAREQGTVEDNTRSELALRDYRQATCRDEPAAPWMIHLRLERDGQVSGLQAEGAPASASFSP